MRDGLLAAAFLAVRVQGSDQGGRRAMRGRAPRGLFDCAAAPFDGDWACAVSLCSPMNASPDATRKLRILMAKPGLDGHDRGVKVIARALRDAGVEVIYTGLHQTPEMIATAAVQEDVDAVGLSIMSGAHNTLCPAILDELKKRSAGDVVVFVGGIIPDADFERLKAAGIRGIFTPGTSLEAIIQWVRDNVHPKA
jgi:methylmalonyl-CoA mutase C-terminal domain/subunit